MFPAGFPSIGCVIGWRLSWIFVALGACLQLTSTAADAAPPKLGADLLKTDILGVFAHPDDETGMAATLARYALGRTAVVANVYCTRGEGGGNMAGTQWGAALGHLREAELRDCLNTLGVRYCFFLDRLDWAYTESAAATLRKWDKDQTLERLVRLVRELRPEVIVSMDPAPNPGQHGHHQAAGLLATEAFSAAARPDRYPLQLSKEGLSVWQARKLYYGGGGSTGFVATIDVNEPLPSGETPAAIAGQALVHHRSQAFGNFSNSPWMRRPQRFTLVKSFVAVTPVETDLLENLPSIDLTEFQFAKPALPRVRLEFVPRPAVANYRRWAAEQRTEHVAAQFNADLPVISGEPNTLRLELVNSNETPIEGTLEVQAPDGWSFEPARRALRATAGSTASVELRVTPPAQAGPDVQVTALFSTGAGPVRASAKLHPVPLTTVVRVSTAPPLDGSDRGWETISAERVSSTNVWQGKVADESDCSARFRLAHDDTALFLDIQVTDDTVISNIAPNDIKGHWRSDSIEICLDPIGGAEDTMGCFKLGVFPFDTTGAVRAARDADANQGRAEETAPKTRLVSRRTAEGYRIQAAIPFEEIGVHPGDRQRLGFNLLIYDGDKRDAAPGENINKSRIAWAPRSGVMGRPEDWGRIDLK